MIPDMQLRRLVRLALALTLSMFALGQAAVVQATTPTLLLPDLTMLPPTDFKIEYANGRKLLRFTTTAVNIGAGPFQVVGYDPTDGNAALTDTLSVKQQIKRSDGTWVERATTAKMQWAGDGHNHWHILGYQKFKLLTLGATALRYTAKTGFCAFDSYLYTSTKPAYYTWEKTCRTLPNGTVFMGTSRNWGDVYKSNLAFQWIDITGLATGDYLLRVIADPPYGSPGQFRESIETNNRAWAKIHIGKSSVSVISRSAKP
jgi:hypothetical protein